MSEKSESDDSDFLVITDAEQWSTSGRHRYLLVMLVPRLLLALAAAIERERAAGTFHQP